MKRIIAFLVLLLAISVPAWASTITVNWSTLDQSIDGFGVSATGVVLDSGVPSAEMDTLFRTDGSNIGLSIVRLEIVPDTTTCATFWLVSQGWGYNGHCVSSSTGTILMGSLATAQGALARAPDELFFASQWSPSGINKSNNSFLTGGSLVAGATNFTNIASEIAGAVQVIKSSGIALYAVSPQNEPDINQSYPSCTWTAQNFSDFVPSLFTALAGSTKIMIAEPSSWNSSYGNTAMTNEPSDIGVLASHGYGGSTNPSQLSYTNQTTQRVWESEMADQSQTYDGSIANAITWAGYIYNYLVNAQVNAWVWWWISGEAYQDNGTDNGNLIDHTGNFAKRAYMTGQWSKFVRPGWTRVDVTNSTGLLVTAFKNPSGTHSAIVVINNTGSDVTNQAFSVGTTMGSNVTPWITSASQNLAPQATVAVVSSTFTYTVTANTIVTFADTNPVTNAQEGGTMKISGTGSIL